MNKKKNKLSEEVVIELNEVLVQKEKPPVISPSTQQSNYQPPQVVNISSNKNPSLQSVLAPSQISNPIKSGQTNSSFNRNSPQQPNSQTSIIQQFNNTKQSKQSQQSNTLIDQPFIPLEFDAQFSNSTNKEPKNIDITLAQLRTLPSYTGPVKM
jgi:hypothetical protein